MTNWWWQIVIMTKSGWRQVYLFDIQGDILSIKKDNIEDYNDSDELRRDLMFETEDELESDLANQIGSIDADGSNCNMPWECNRPCPIGYFR